MFLWSTQFLLTKCFVSCCHQMLKSDTLHHKAGLCSMVCVGFRQAGWHSCTVLHLQYPTRCLHGHIGFLHETGISLISLPLCRSFCVFLLTYFPECKPSRCQVMVAQAYSSCHSEMHEWRWPVIFLARPFVYRKCAMTVGNFTVSNVAAGVRALSCRFFSQSVY